MHEKRLEKVIPNMTKGLMLTTALKRKAASSSGLILPDQFELSEIQRVIKVGPYVASVSASGQKVSFGEGDWVKINFTRFVKPKAMRSLKDGNEFDETMLDFYIPIVTFGGEDYLEIDQGDVEYYWNHEDVD